MPLPWLFELGPGAGNWSTYQYMDWVDHQEIVQAIKAQKGVSLPLYPSFAMAPNRFEDWLGMNEQAHQDMCAAVGVGHQDLSDLDLTDPDAVRSWLYQQASEHQWVRSTLKI